MPETMHVAAMSHVAICVRHLDRSLAFYRDLLGMPVVLDTEMQGEMLEREVAMPGARLRLALLSDGDSPTRANQLDPGLGGLGALTAALRFRFAGWSITNARRTSILPSSASRLPASLSSFGNSGHLRIRAAIWASRLDPPRDSLPLPD